MRLKAALRIIVIAIIITAANTTASLVLTRQSLAETAKKDISLAIDIANDLVSTRISLYKTHAQTVAEWLLEASDGGDMEKVMREQLARFEGFMAITVFDRQGVAAEVGGPTALLSWPNCSKHILDAFDGKTVISTTRNLDATGELVMHIFAPMGGDRVVSVTFPGNVFSELLGRYVLWHTGKIFMIDEAGTIIASHIPDLVKSRTNFIMELELSNPGDPCDFFSEAPQGKNAEFNYIYKGVGYQCAYTYVGVPDLGWRIGLSVPLAESPVTVVQNRLIFLGVLFLVVSIVAACVSSGFIVKPYYEIAAQNQRLEEFNSITLKLRAELEAALADAHAANAAKRRFLASMSHEMRSPLNAVIGLSELILGGDEASGEVSGEARSNLGKIYTSGMTLLGIVNDILDISKIESGNFELSPIEYDVPSLINDILSLNTVLIGEKPIMFILTVDEGLPERVFGDDLRVKQVFNNILSNAFKYTSSGTVEWKVSFEREGDSVWLVSDVVDTGIGVKPEDISKLFMDYTQVDARVNREAEGTGLGLSITRRLAEMMDGDVSVKSDYGKGSVFSVYLRQQHVTDRPIGKETAKNLMGNRFFSSNRARHASLPRMDLSYAHVLVVDDMPNNLDIAKGMLLPYRLKVECAASAREAIGKIRSGQPRFDAVFMDHMMPEMDGIEAVRVIREEIGTDYARNLPVIALTANAIAGNDEMFLANGFQAFISKPIDMMMLDAVLRQWVRDKNRELVRGAQPVFYSAGSAGSGGPVSGAQTMRHGVGGSVSGVQTVRHGAGDFTSDVQTVRHGAGEGAPATGHAVPPIGSAAIDGVDISAGIRRFAGDEDAFMNVLRSYAANTRPILGELSWLLSSEDLDTYATKVHGLRGSSFGVCASEAGSRAELLELVVKAGEPDLIRVENDTFIKYMNHLLDAVDGALASYYPEEDKIVLAAPDPATLKELRDACGEYDVGKVDRAVALLDSYRYESGADLVAWLLRQAEDMNYAAIAGGEWPGQL